MPEFINPNGASGVGPIRPPMPPSVPGGPAPADGKSFMAYLEEKMGQVDNLQQASEKAIQNLATGQEEDLGKVVSAVEKANLAFQMMVQIRNKLVDAYQEMMRIRT